MIITERQTMHGHEILIKERRHTRESGYPVVTIKCITYVTGQYLKNLDTRFRGYDGFVGQ